MLCNAYDSCNIIKFLSQFVGCHVILMWMITVLTKRLGHLTYDYKYKGSVAQGYLATGSPLGNTNFYLVMMFVGLIDTSC